MQFNQLGLSAQLLKTLEAQGYTTPTPIQAKAIPVIMTGKDVLGCAQTGTGKTAAFALPILHQLVSTPVQEERQGRRLPRVLVLSPTRELALQIADSFKTYGQGTRTTGTVIYGGVGQGAQVRDLKRGIDVIVACPGRLIDLMEQGYVDLSGIQTLVLDEADRMLDMGFIHPIRRIAGETPDNRQTLLFSATMPSSVRQLADSLLTDPVSIAVTPVASAAPKIEQSLYLVNKLEKQDLLRHLLKDDSAQRVVVFTKTKHGADRVGEKLEKAGIAAETIHGNKAQNARQRALNAFKSGKSRVLVATDVAARGLDVDDVTHVINYDLPMEPEAYVHRIGRTARAGATGIAISFCDPGERALLKDVERLLKGKIPQKPLPEFDRSPREHRPDTRPLKPGQPRAQEHVDPRAILREIAEPKPQRAAHEADPGHLERVARHPDRRQARPASRPAPAGGAPKPRQGFGSHNRKTGRR